MVLCGEKVSEWGGPLHLTGKGRTRANGWKLELDTVRLEIRSALLRVWLMNHWPNLTKSMVDSL